jgi:ABC-2 type transport system permease protein
MRMRVWMHVFHLGLKELVALRHDPVLMIFIIYAFSLDIIAAVDQSVQIRNASVAIVDEDHSPLSRRLSDLFFPPYFQTPAQLAEGDIDHALDTGRYTFVVDVPPKFQADLRAGRDTDLQINVDATAVAQAFTGSYYIQQIIEDEVARYLDLPSPEELAPVKAVVRIKYNQNTDSSWFLSVAEMLQMITVLTMLLPAAALIREQEHGTIEHLLVMPLTPAEIMLAKVWASALVVQVGTLACWYLVLDTYLGVPLRGSLPLFLFGTFVYQFTITAIGMFLATLVRTVAQFVLLLLLVITPMIFLSGIFTPIESMPQLLKYLMVISPMRYYVEFAYAVIVREAGLAIVVRELAIMALIGAASFTVALLRFRRHFAAAAGR